MDVKSNRKVNILNQLAIYRAQGWTDKKFATHCGIEPAHLSQMKSGVRNVGDEVARRIEKALDLEYGYLDLKYGPAELKRELESYEVTAGRKVMKVTDEAMAPTFSIGDSIWYVPNEMPDPGKFAVVEINNKLTVRKYREELIKGTVTGFWSAINPAYSDVPADQVTLVGRAATHVVEL